MTAIHLGLVLFGAFAVGAMAGAAFMRRRLLRAYDAFLDEIERGEAGERQRDEDFG